MNSKNIFLEALEANPFLKKETTTTTTTLEQILQFSKLQSSEKP